MCCCSDCNLVYGGGTPGADANTYVFINSVTAGWPGHFAAMTGSHKLVVSLSNSQAGTFKFYLSNDRGTNWTQSTGDVAVGIPAAGTTNDYEFLIEHAKDFKLEFTNGGVAQATWAVFMSLVGDRAVA